MNDAKTETQIQILAVDDEENILRSLNRLLLNENLEVLTANSGKDALEILKANSEIALIVSDQRMPGMTGVEVLEQAKEIAPDTVRILLTGYADINATVDAINRGGAHRYITKPWKDEELIQIIQDAVQRYILIKDNKRLAAVVQRQNDELKDWNSQLEDRVHEQTAEIQEQNKELQGLNEKLKANFKNTIYSFSNLLELRGLNAGGHVRNVAELSLKVARQLDLDRDEVESITVASLLHDIGKIGIPDVLIIKDEDDMNAEELDVYSQHPIRGQTAVDSIEDLREAGLIIRHHHEWYNGGGFPDKLSGKKIPVGSRIVAMADFIDRTVNKPDTDNDVEFALKKVKEELGKKFDPKIYPLIEAPAREIYAKISQQRSEIEMELYPEDLKDGMVISKDVRSGTGLLIMSKGTKLNGKNIGSLNRYYMMDPAKRGVFVMVRR